MKPFSNYSPRYRAASVKQVVLVSLGSAAVLAGFYGLSHFGPSSYETTAERVNLGKDEADRLRVTAEDAETRWNVIKEKRIKDGEPFTDADLILIGEAAVARLKYETMVPGVEPRYRYLEKDLHDRSAELLRAESVALEKRAAAAERAKNYEDARTLYTEALALEERINNEFGEAAIKDVRRTNVLTTRMRFMTARPMWELSLAREKEAERLATQGKIDAALKNFESARDANRSLEMDYRGMTSADTFRTRHLDRRIATLRSLILRDQALATLARAEKLVSEEKYDDLNELRTEVENIAHLLGDRFPDSEYAKPEYLQDLRRRAHNAACAPEAVAIERDLAAFRKAVHAGDRSVATRVEGLQRAVMRARELFPHSDRIGEDLARHITYLFEHRTEINMVGKAVNAMTVPVPGRPNTRAFARETTQGLYTLLMGDNPSAMRGEDRPVESLTQKEAAEFCRRLGWMLAADVNLPTCEDFFDMSGKPDSATIRKNARLIENSNGKVERSPAATPDANGYQDLYGNVAEWLLTPDPETPGNVFTGGGDAESTAVQLAKNPFSSKPAEERSRFVGFRPIIRDLP